MKAIQTAEEVMAIEGKLYCLGDIVHNDKELERLVKKGLQVINQKELRKLKNCKVLIRAHGEPPSTYKIAQDNNIEIIDATCPVVIKYQKNLRKKHLESKEKHSQVVIYGKKKHPEVIGLLGQVDNHAIVISKFEDIENINYSLPIDLFAQTTMNRKEYSKISDKIKSKIKEKGTISKTQFNIHNTICRQVSKRDKQLKDFASKHDVIIFISGRKSSNGKYLFDVCKSVNKNSYFVSNKDDIVLDWLDNCKTIGISGATSTPLWLIEDIAGFIEEMIKD